MKLGKIFDQIKRKGLLPSCFLILLALAGGGRPVYAEEMTGVTENTKVMDVIEDPDFEGFGRLIFPADKTIDPDLELKDVGDILTWYNYVNPERTVEIVNYMKEQAEEGEQIFYDIYTEEEYGIVFLPRRSRREIRSGKCRGRFCLCGCYARQLSPGIGTVKKRLQCLRADLPSRRADCL